MGNVARVIGGSLVAPPVDPIHIQRYFGELKVFGAVDELVTMVTGGVPVNTAATDVDLERALQYGSHLSVIEHLPTILKKIGDDVRRQKCLATQKSAAHESRITEHRSWRSSRHTRHGYSMILRSRNGAEIIKRWLNRETEADTVSIFCAPKRCTRLLTNS